MKNKAPSESLYVRYPKFSCYQKVKAKNDKNNPKNGAPTFKLFSKKCKPGNECLATECPVEK